MTVAAALHKIRPADLPAPPQSALAMLRACSRDDVDNRQLADFAQTDPLLTAELLRVVNTPLFGLGSEVTSVRHAISLLGVRALRNIVLCLMVCEAVQAQRIPGFDITGFWEDTLRRAVAARLLGAQLGLDEEECFSAGLLQDFGLLILFHLQPQHAEQFSAMRMLAPPQRRMREVELFGVSHDQVLGLLASEWSLPTPLAEALTHHHDESTDNRMAGILLGSDWIASLFCSTEMNPLLERVEALLRGRYELVPALIETLLAQIPQAVETAAAALGLHIEQQADFEQLLRQANSRLAHENISYQELTWQLEKAIAERDQLAEALNKEIAIAQEVQRRLMPGAAPAGFPVHGFNLPARNISGDFFDYFVQRDGSIWFTLGDVSGKGINAGLLMAKTASLFHCLAKHMQDPARLLSIINNEICESSVRGFFVTMVAGIYQPRQRQVQLVNAGHLPALIIRDDGEVSRLPATEQPLGILPDTRFTLSAPVALAGASLYLYTDGVTEARLDDGQMFGEDSFIALLQQQQAATPAQRLQAIRQAIKPAAQAHDDITLLLIDGKA